MRSVLIQLDDATYRALNQIAPPRTRRRSEFLRQAIREGIRMHQYARMREAYIQQPARLEGDDWTNWEPFESGASTRSGG